MLKITLQLLLVFAVFRKELYAFARLIFRVFFVVIPVTTGLFIRDRLWDFRHVNDPVLFIYPSRPKGGVWCGRIHRRSGDAMLAGCDWRVYGWPPYPGSLAFEIAHLKLADEGVTWCRGHEGEDADAFRAAAVMA